MTDEDFWTSLSSSIFPFSDDLNSQQIYNQLNGLKGYKAYISKCETISSVPHRNQVQIICARLLEYLKSDIISIKENDEYDVCTLLSFWVYSRLFELFQFKGKDYAKIAYGDIQRIWTGFIDDKLNNPKNKICKPIFDLAVYDDWRDRKELYEYYVDYSALSQTVKNYKHMCNDFYRYVQSKKKLYKHFKEPCLKKDKMGCPKFYAQCEQYDPEKVLPHHDCYNEIRKEGAPTALSVPQLTNGHSVNKSDSEEGDGPMKPDDAPKLSGKPQTVENVGNILLGVVATTMTSGALYRFTPLGGMIRNGLGWNNNNMRNFNGRDIRLYDYASEPFNPYPGEEHYIGYHPA